MPSDAVGPAHTVTCGQRRCQPGQPCSGLTKHSALGWSQGEFPALQLLSSHTKLPWMHSASNSQMQRKVMILCWEDSSCQSYWERDKVFVSPSGNTYLKWPAWCLWNWGQNYIEFTANQCVVATAVSFYSLWKKFNLLWPWFTTVR